MITIDEAKTNSDFSGIEYENWEEMNNSDKIDIIQKVVNYEAIKLGIPSGKVVTDKMDDVTIALQGNRGIFYNSKKLKNISFNEAVYSAIHEVYHLYQKNLIGLYNKLDEDEKNLYLFDELHIKEYIKEFSDCKIYDTKEHSDYEDYLSYVNQYAEADVNLYAKKEIDNVLREIGIEVENKEAN